MKIFYELTHTACDSSIMRAPAEFDVYHSIGGWDSACRPKPENATLVRSPRGPYDLAVVGTKEGLAMVPNGVPAIWKCLIDFGKWPRPEDILGRVSAWVAPCRETVDRWSMKDHPKAHVIEHGIDSDLFTGYVGTKPSVMTVGNFMPKRPEKGPDVLADVANRIPVDLYGFGNESVGSSQVRIKGTAPDVKTLADVYRNYRVYFNPSHVVVCAVLEAMSTGMPVVTMEPTNFKDLMKHRVNCFIAKDASDAAYWLGLLVNNKDLAEKVGRDARESVKYRFHPSYTSAKWNVLFNKLARRDVL